MVVEQKKEEKRKCVFKFVWLHAARFGRAYGRNGMLLSYLATTMTLPRSPILIPQLSYKIKNFMFYNGQDNESGRARMSPHTCRLTSQNRFCNNTYWLLLVTK